MKNLLSKNLSLIKGNASLYLDVIRAIAAIVVVLHHIRGEFFVDYSNVINQNISTKLLYFFTGIGKQAVIVFFVLSGFFISGNVLKSLFQKKWSWSIYLTNRLTRLYIVLIPSLLITSILDMVDKYLFSNTLQQYSDSFYTLLGNLFFLQGVLVPYFGTNAPLWSLNYELWYYILFPSILLVVFSKTSYIKRIVGTILIFSLFLFLGQKIALYFVIWCIGSVVLVLPKKDIKSKFNRISYFIIGLFLFIFCLVASRFNRFGGDGSDLSAWLLLRKMFVEDAVIAIGFAIFMYVLISVTNGSEGKDLNRNKTLSRVSSALAGSSYTLYLTHYPILMFVKSIFIYRGINKFQPTFSFVLIGIIMTLTIIGVAYLISLLTERHTKTVRDIIIQKRIKGIKNANLNVN